MNRSVLLRTLLCLAACALPLAGMAQEKKATPAEAVAMVKQAVATIKRESGAKAYAEISDHKGPFVVHDLYVAVYGLDGMVRAHGGNAT